MKSIDFNKLLVLSSPVLFLLAWSTGYPAAVGILEYMSALTALMLRLGLIVLCLYAILIIRHHSWRCIGMAVPHILIALGTGVLLHGIGMMAVFQTIDWGYPAGLTALIYGMQPILLAVGALVFLSERLTLTIALGLLLSFTGVIITVTSSVAHLQGGLFWLATFVCLLGLIAGTAGMLLNKYCTRLKMPYVRSLFWQYGGAFLAFVPFYLASETHNHIVWNWPAVFYLGWLVLPASIGALLLMLYLLEHHMTYRVGSLLYLTSPTAAVMVWLLFGQSYPLLAILGFALNVLGVFAVIRVKTGRENEKQAQTS